MPFDPKEAFCEKCIYWNNSWDWLGNCPDEEPDYDQGQCRRFPLDRRRVEPAYTEHTYYCGEFKKKPKAKTQQVKR